MMDGFGVHTFRLINDEGKSTFVKFHWRPVLGTHSMAWEECQQISGKDPDFHRRDLWDTIEAGNFPEYEFAVQLIPEEDELKYEFDLLDPTKIVPEELVPLQRVGRMVLNRNPDNFFAETEQVAFHTGNIVPGIDFSNDPLLQGRLFSYLDTQLLRLGGPNFTHIPINAPLAKVNTNHRDGFHQHIVHAGKASYFPNSIGDGNPDGGRRSHEGFVAVPRAAGGEKVRRRGGSFLDHFSQAAMFYRGQSEAEKQHLIAAAQFELGMCEVMAVRERVVANFNKRRPRHGGAGCPGHRRRATGGRTRSAEPAYSAPEVSVENTAHDSIKTRQVAVLLADGFDADQLETPERSKLTAEGAKGGPDRQDPGAGQPIRKARRSRR